MSLNRKFVHNYFSGSELFRFYLRVCDTMIVRTLEHWLVAMKLNNEVIDSIVNMWHQTFVR